MTPPTPAQISGIAKHKANQKLITDRIEDQWAKNNQPKQENPADYALWLATVVKDKSYFLNKKIIPNL